MKHINFGKVFIKFSRYYLLGLLALFCTEAIYYSYIVSPSDYVQYSAIEPSKKTYWIGEEDLFFRSFATIKRDSTIEWEDILSCDLKGDEFRGGYFSSYISSKTNAKPSRWDGDGVWRYGSDIPIQEASCELRSTTFVVFKIFLAFELKKPIEPIKSTHKFRFKKRK